MVCPIYGTASNRIPFSKNYVRNVTSVNIYIFKLSTYPITGPPPIKQNAIFALGPHQEAVATMRAMGYTGGIE